MTIFKCMQLFRKLAFNPVRIYTTDVVNMANQSNDQERAVLQTKLAHCGDNMDDVLKEATFLLKEDKIISVPTDTIYGLAGLAQSSKAVDRIYEIKSRSQRKPIAICVGEVHDIYKWGKVTVVKEMLQELLPGPVTVVFERTVALNPNLNPGTSLVGIRVPNYNFVQKLAQSCGEPLALTSANMSSEPSTLSVEEFKHLWPNLDLVIDGGILGNNKQSQLGSTVVDLSKVGKYTIIRSGSAYENTTEILKKYGLTEDEKR